VLEEDEEIGDGESSENGLDSLLEDVEGLLASRTRDQHVLSSIREKSPRASSETVEVLHSGGNGLFRSLKEMNVPTELYDATALLLQSSLLDETTARLLTKDIMDLSAYDEHISSVDNNNDSMATDVLNQSTEETAIDNGSDENVKWNASLDDNGGEIDSGGEDEATNEASALLSTPIQNEEILKPSIFTMH
jgi:hypothetical protein